MNHLILTSLLWLAPDARFRAERWAIRMPSSMWVKQAATAFWDAAPDAVGITSTGAEGPNRLPEALAAYRQFEAWVAGGAAPEAQPVFASAPAG